ncbi:MAG: hypothetical protein KF809_14785 [Chloroflexi bacterium]|nr:hypothetical protein [Chloroflexota bacterium]
MTIPTDASTPAVPAATRTFRQRVLAGETLFGTFSNIGALAAAEIVARAGLDWVLIDLEHGAGTEANLVPQLAAVSAAGATALVRVEQGTRLRIGRVLDLGAEGVMVPQVADAAAAQEVAAWLRYPPAGRRGVALFTRGLDYGTGGHTAVDVRNEQVTGIVQIESGEAAEASDIIAAIDGVDVLFVGPADLTHAMGIRGDITHPDYQRAIERVATAARAHGKAAGVMLWSPADVTRYADLGYTIFSLSTDGGLLNSAVRSALQAGRAAISSR